jgi:hypothetical protein
MPELPWSKAIRGSSRNTYLDTATPPLFGLLVGDAALFFYHVDGLKRSLGMPHGLGWEATGGEEAWRSSGLEMLM